VLVLVDDIAIYEIAGRGQENSSYYGFTFTRLSPAGVLF